MFFNCTNGIKLSKASHITIIISFPLINHYLKGIWNQYFFPFSHYPPNEYKMLCAIWYHLYNIKNKKNTHGGGLHLVKLQAWVLLSVKLQAFRKIPPWMFFTFFTLQLYQFSIHTMVLVLRHSFWKQLITLHNICHHDTKEMLLKIIDLRPHRIKLFWWFQWTLNSGWQNRNIILISIWNNIKVN